MIEVHFLGTGAAIPSKHRGHTSIALRYNGEIILFDCGENIQRQMIWAGLSPMKISRIFITHFHADHFAGLLALPQSLGLLKRKEPLYVYGPKGTEKVSKHLKVLIGDLEYDLKFAEIKEAVENEKYIVSSIPVRHEIPSLAYSFEEKPKRKFLEEKAKKLGVFGRDRGKLQRGETLKIKGKTIRPEDVLSEPIKGKKIVYSGDTGYCEELIKFAEDADLLIHEATFGRDKEREAADYLHSTAEEAAKIAKSAGVKKLALVHISPRYKNPKVLEEEAKEIFKNTEVCADLDVLTI